MTTLLAVVVGLSLGLWASPGRPLFARLLMVLGYVFGSYLTARAIAEPFVIDPNQPGSYRNDWGGPSLIGVLAVPMLPGIIAAVLMIRTLTRRLS